ncbi:hypothetical protein DBV05_g7035 [Lasiodiplodia theobromae]|uniref:Uncharacterized protein n=1 Tax=Lasiodiplodia theobromae TaxID=45133 RepID=A0A5N5D9M7_9PEZI|nr:hypothetical protein DBV05_g7035 [Lasiodiplodia theobromae]
MPPYKLPSGLAASTGARTTSSTSTTGLIASPGGGAFPLLSAVQQPLQRHMHRPGDRDAQDHDGAQLLVSCLRLTCEREMLDVDASAEMVTAALPP